MVKFLLFQVGGQALPLWPSSPEDKTRALLSLAAVGVCEATNCELINNELMNYEFMNEKVTNKQLKNANESDNKLMNVVQMNKKEFVQKHQEKKRKRDSEYYYIGIEKKS
jgi:hypothetical protein